MKLSSLLVMTAAAVTACAAPVEVPKGIDHARYDQLLKKYVNDRGLVDYKAWKSSADDMKALRDYTGKFVARGPYATGNDKAASLINAYNALTIQWILDNYPTKSIKRTANPWGEKRFSIDCRVVSLNEIEHDTLRPEFGYRIHAVLVCAARSCPPLRNSAYSADKLDEQLDDAMRRWLARDDLNKFSPADRRVELSNIFKWYGSDFQKADGGLRAVLAKYTPVEFADFLKTGYKISHLSYNWDLNEQ